MKRHSAIIIFSKLKKKKGKKDHLLLFQIKRKSGKGVTALFLCFVTRTFKSSSLKKGGKKEGKEGLGKKGGRKGGNMRREEGREHEEDNEKGYN